MCTIYKKTTSFPTVYPFILSFDLPSHNKYLTKKESVAQWLKIQYGS